MINPILIQGAMKVETEYLIKNLTNSQKIILNGYEYYKGIVNDAPTVISVTKVGTVNAAISTILAINKFNPVLVINQGVAGGYDTKIHKGDIVLGEYVANMSSYRTGDYKENEGIHADKWTFLDWNEGKKTEKEKISSDINLLNKVEKLIKNNFKSTIHKGLILSGDAWNNEVDRIKFFINYFGALAEDMESYAVYKVCNDNNIPVLGIRMISNNKINEETYDKNLAEKLQMLIFEFIKYMN